MRTNRDISRLQSFSDGVFALAATLLVVTLEVPGSYDALLEAMAGFPAFALGFAALVSLWYNHRQFFAEYPLGDGWTVALNSLLLFIVLLYVYPLKLLTAVVAERFLGATPDVVTQMGSAEIQGLFLIYGAGFVAIFAVFTALYVRAWRLRDELALDELGRYELLQNVASFAAIALVGVLSMLAAALGLGLGWGLPFWLYLLAPIVAVVERLLTAGRRQQLQAASRRRRAPPS